jgi:hypothetical protein
MYDFLFVAFDGRFEVDAAQTVGLEAILNLKNYPETLH